MTSQRHTAGDAALQIIKRLRAERHTALLAGGCVRDRLLAQTPKDFDVVTDAPPERVKEIFPRARKVGAKFGVMLVRKYGFDTEVATFRSDGTYSDGRHPDQVTFSSDLEDAKRRDFTINGLFYDPIDDRVIDYVGGRADLEAGILRTIGDPEQRFGEDHLRMLRAVRFAARLGFEVEPTTMAAIKTHAAHLQSISAERIWIELEAILTPPTRAKGWDLLRETGLRSHLAASWPANVHEDDLVERCLALLPDRPIDAALAMAVCMRAYSPKEIGEISRALRLSNRLLNAVVWLVGSLPAARAASSLELADLKMLMGHAEWNSLLELLRADSMATGGDTEPHDCLVGRAAGVAEADVTPPPFITGADLADCGISPGPRVGRLLKAAYRAQLNEQVTSRAQALEYVRDLIASGAG